VRTPSRVENNGAMPEQWKKVAASEVRTGDQIRLQTGQSLTVSRIEPAFMGRTGLLAFIQDTSEGWFKQPMPDAAEVEVLRTD
jgi:hypothetical protein